MLQSIRNIKGLRFFCAFIALYLLNCSVDSNDNTPICVPENLAINDQESIIELVVEKVLGFENAIPENEDTDEDNASPFKKRISITFYVLPHTSQKINTVDRLSELIFFGFKIKNFSQPLFEIHSPPPEV